MLQRNKEAAVVDYTVLMVDIIVLIAVAMTIVYTLLWCVAEYAEWRNSKRTKE